MTDPDYRALCAELAEALHEHTCLYEGHESELVARARALLAEPEPEGPTDEELRGVFVTNGAWPGGLRAVADLAADRARWGRPTPQPVAEELTIPNAKLHYLELTPCEVKRLIEALDFAIGDTVTRPNTGNHHAVRAKLKRSIPNALPTPEATND